MGSFLLKITLHATPNLIWRRFVVPSFMTLNRLHETVQTVMGWQRKHSHVFYLGRQAYVPTENPRVEGLPEEMFVLDDLLYRTGARLKYLYDPEKARWMHDIAVESIRYRNPDWPYPVYCLEGVRACPPESCEGASGFAELLRGLKRPGHPEHAEWIERFGTVDFDHFDVERVNKALKVKGPVKKEDATEMRVISPPPSKSESKAVPLDPLQRLGMALKSKAAS